MKKKEVAIVIPLHKRSFLTDSEKISLKHLNYFLGDYDKFFLAPNNLSFKSNDIPVAQFDESYFGSLEAHNYLCLSQELYNRFSDYEYIFMYHLDCLVFDNNLSEWLEMGYDYIAPPWIIGPDIPWLKSEGVGNGGFSLRKVEAFQKLLNSNIRWEDFRTKIRKFLSSGSMSKAFGNGVQILTHISLSKNNIQNHLDYYFTNGGHEDRFLWKFGSKYYPKLNIAPIDVALNFGFEANPRICYERNNFELPFGCHAWEKYDKEFWLPFLIE